MKADVAAGRDVGEQWVLVEEQDQTRPLVKVSGGGAAADESLGLGQEVVWEAGAVQRCRARQREDPRATNQRGSMNHSLTVADDVPATTLQLIAVRTTKPPWKKPIP
jgi:hypothetical protein